jgi:MFS family permease
MTPAGSAVDRTFRSLRSRNYRLYFFGQIISLTGTWMQSVGQAWLVLELTGSGVALGIVTALQFLPILLAGAWGGVVADRVDKRKVIIATQTAAAVLALALGLLTVTGAVRLWMVYALAFGLGLVNLVDMPTRQSFVFEMVGKEDVTNAVSLNSVVVNASRVVGPAVAGLLIATVGIGICFLVNGASYVAVIAGLHLMDPARLQDQPRAPRARGQLREGLRYVWRTSELRTPILLMAAVGTIAYNFSVLFPLLVRSTFGRGAGAYGTLFSLMGVGAVLGGLVVAARSRATASLLVGSTIALGALLWLSALAPSFWLEMIAVVPVGAASTAFIATSNAMLQLHSAPQMRGRVMALFTVVFLGTTPIGAPIVGWIAQGFGPRAGLASGATTTLLAGFVALVVLARRRKGSKGVVQGRPMTDEGAQAVTAA